MLNYLIVQSVFNKLKTLKEDFISKKYLFFLFLTTSAVKKMTH